MKQKKHTCKGLRAALKTIESFKGSGPYCLPIFQDNWISGETTGYLGTDNQVEKALGGTLHQWYAEIKFCPFCGFEYKEENK